MDSPIVSAAEMRAAEEAAFARGIEVEDLMDQAGAGIARAVRQFFPRPGSCIVYAGKGHNGGDALVAAECLQRAGWQIDVRLPFPEDQCSELTRKKLAALRDGRRDELPLVQELAAASPSATIILDGLLGIGTKSFLREPIRATAREINALRLARNAFVFAVDVPTGFSDTGEIDPDSVVADFTVTIGFAKHSLITDAALDFVGRIEVVPLPDLSAEGSGNEILATAPSLATLLPRRKFGAYKNQFGRIGVVAGSKGFIGAAMMTASGALRAGAGLVELFVPDDIYEIAAAAASPEVMVKSTRGYRDLADEKMDVWAVGPGLGKAHAARIRDLIARVEQPMVVDADGLNVLAEEIDVLKRFRGPRLLTPHPGEMERIFPSGKMSRAGIARNFTDQFAATLLLKGSRTIVAQKDLPLSYNQTGNPGMATGGMGDVLTGVCAGLIAQGISLYDAARLGAWLCGRAAEICVFEKDSSEESLLPRDVLDNLGAVFNDLRCRVERSTT
ncbi:MAG TPA: NAD(P)H-hydrate dehydratase [Chthoniobacterales bacterium]|nr:NAD(P)H-hydrate dehydratase [Chthoniobacterales bacterium]